MAAGEQQPLLDGSPSAKTKTSVPYGQLALLTLWRTAHPICFAFILPWIARFLVDTGIATQTNVGYYAGWVESSYSVSFVIGLVPAALLSDSIGRKTTALVGQLCAAVACAAFGLASSFWHLILLRICLGFFVAFLPATVSTMLLENSNKDSQAVSFAANALGWQLGSMLSPVLGGTLARPASTWPGVFHGIWEDYPYFLPGLVVATYVTGISIVGAIVIKETLPKEKRRSLLLDKHVVVMLFLWFFMVFVVLVEFSQEVLFFYTPRRLGGLELSSKEMAIMWSIRPPMVAAFETFAYPIMARQWTPEVVLRYGAAGQPILYLIYFCIGWYARSEGSRLYIFVGLCSHSVLKAALNPMYLACSQILVSRAPSRAYLTRINTAAELVANAGHGIGALVGSNYFQFVVEHQVLQGKAFWILPLALSVILYLITLGVEPVRGWRELEAEEAGEAAEDS